jgi:hypothetical protein
VARLVSFLKLAGGPGSLRLLAILVALGLVWIYLWPRRPRAGWLGIASIALVYVVLATPVVALAIAHALPSPRTIPDSEIRDIQTLFFFDGDNRPGRLREFERVYALAEPRHVVLLGRLSVFKDLLLMDIPRDRLRHDTTAWNTRGQVDRVRQLMAAGTTGPAAILASRLQAPRVTAFVRAAGLPLPVIPSPLDTTLPVRGAARFVPSLAALEVSRDAIYELAALRYYGIAAPGAGSD